ncbi:MAG: histidine phosphatase family protein [Anaerolineae bacterium]|nr:histidine phosphatase family protein [Anaerolineae bacterium]
MSKIVYLIRHAAPQDGTGIRYDIPPGPPLSTGGRREAHAVAEFLAERGIERVVHSPLDRTTQTAHTLAERLGLAPAIDERLAEHRRDEKPEDVRTRVQTLWQEELARPEQAIALVSHGSPLRLLIETLTEGRETFSGYRFPGGNVIPTGGVWQVRQGIGGLWEALFIFQPNILPEPQPAPAWAGGGRVV